MGGVFEHARQFAIQHSAPEKFPQGVRSCFDFAIGDARIAAWT